jgi:hypothetical protein
VVRRGIAPADTEDLDAAFEQKVHHDEILRGVNLPVNEVHSPKARISLKQLMIACKNAIGLLSDRHLPFRIGTSIHISTYGMYGFAILCCPDFRKAMDFATKYYALAAPLATIDFHEKKGLASWTIEPNVHAATDPQLYRFITEMQIGIHISLMRDIMGSAFAPHEICLTYPEAQDFCLPADQVGCDIRSTSRSNQIVFQSTWPDQAASLGNKTTYPTIVALCDERPGFPLAHASRSKRPVAPSVLQHLVGLAGLGAAPTMILGRSARGSWRRTTKRPAMVADRGRRICHPFFSLSPAGDEY